jgi:hypothetical protein
MDAPAKDEEASETEHLRESPELPDERSSIDPALLKVMVCSLIQ